MLCTRLRVDDQFVMHLQGNDIEAVYRVTHIHNTLHTGSVQGIIGPSTSKEAQILSPLVTKLYKRPMVRAAYKRYICYS